ncbi:Lsr2 family protein [Cellulosimicrobium sp. Marseille-Q4280]|uniref:histone-like nucleoid-structuring protein Lsr2 n=1 Tax=Cellulosimicrobium sp. Marseille-Q4280 TaxID=2937992 RepID=UPI00203D2F39|nr:Lsr2 family protein [Cellulosimicrobium sp. Marseille-Q4280]
MAQRIEVSLIDDVDGGKAAETVTFALDGVAYEIDVSTENAGKLRDDLSRFVQHGRRIASRRPGRRTARSAPSPDRAAVRTWARENGHEVSGRGRIPQGVLAAYEAAH